MRHPGAPPPFPIPDFDRAPLLVIWETTQACGLSCRHCRASAQPGRRPRRAHDRRGAAPRRRGRRHGHAAADLERRRSDQPARPRAAGPARQGRAACASPRSRRPRSSSPTSGSPSSRTRASTRSPSRSTSRARTSTTRFRLASGAFDRTIEAAAWARQLGLPLQINTTVCGETAPYLAELGHFVANLGIVFWEVFFLVPMGRGKLLRGLSADECERLYDDAVGGRVEGALRAEGHRGAAVPALGRAARRRAPGRPATAHAPIGLSPKAVNSGKGFLFVSHLGEIFPSGFLPVAGRQRARDLARAAPTATRACSATCAIPTGCAAAAAAASSARAAAARGRARSRSPATRRPRTPGAPTCRRRGAASERAMECLTEAVPTRPRRAGRRSIARGSRARGTRCARALGRPRLDPSRLLQPRAAGARARGARGRAAGTSSSCT